MSARDGDPLLERVRAALTEWHHASDDPKEAAEYFQKVLAVVRTVYNNRLPFDLQQANDPGALFEYDGYLQHTRTEAGRILQESITTKNLTPDDPRASRAQEVLREAFFYAYKQHWGFEAIGRPPELQQLIAATCLDIFTTYACSRADDPISDSAHLLQQLCPMLQVNLLADVATGILCPSQPLPPDTPQHASALYAFIYQAFDSICYEVSSRDACFVETLCKGCDWPTVQYQRAVALPHTHAVFAAPPPRGLLSLYVQQLRRVAAMAKHGSSSSGGGGDGASSSSGSSDNTTSSSSRGRGGDGASSSTGVSGNSSSSRDRGGDGASSSSGVSGSSRSRADQVDGSGSSSRRADQDDRSGSSSKVDQSTGIVTSSSNPTHSNRVAIISTSSRAAAGGPNSSSSSRSPTAPCTDATTAIIFPHTYGAKLLWHKPLAQGAFVAAAAAKGAMELWSYKISYILYYIGNELPARCNGAEKNVHAAKLPELFRLLVNMVDPLPTTAVEVRDGMLLILQTLLPEFDGLMVPGAAGEGKGTAGVREEAGGEGEHTAAPGTGVGRSSSTGFAGKSNVGRSSNQTQQQHSMNGTSPLSSPSASAAGGGGGGADGAGHCPAGNSSSSTDGAAARLLQRLNDLIAAVPVDIRLMLAGVVLGLHLSLDAAALVWRFLEAAEQSGSPAWEDDVALQVVLLLQEAQGLGWAAEMNAGFVNLEFGCAKDVVDKVLAAVGSGATAPASCGAGGSNEREMGSSSSSNQQKQQEEQEAVRWPAQQQQEEADHPNHHQQQQAELPGLAASEKPEVRGLAAKAKKIHRDRNAGAYQFKYVWEKVARFSQLLKTFEQANAVRNGGGPEAAAAATSHSSMSSSKQQHLPKDTPGARGSAPRPSSSSAAAAGCQLANPAYLSLVQQAMRVKLGFASVGADDQHGNGNDSSGVNAVSSPASRGSPCDTRRSSSSSSSRWRYSHLEKTAGAASEACPPPNSSSSSSTSSSSSCGSSQLAGGSGSSSRGGCWTGGETPVQWSRYASSGSKVMSSTESSLRDAYRMLLFMQMRLFTTGWSFMENVSEKQNRSAGETAAEAGGASSGEELSMGGSKGNTGSKGRGEGKQADNETDAEACSDTDELTGTRAAVEAQKATIAAAESSSSSLEDAIDLEARLGDVCTNEDESELVRQIIQDQKRAIDGERRRTEAVTQAVNPLIRWMMDWAREAEAARDQAAKAYAARIADSVRAAAAAASTAAGAGESRRRQRKHQQPSLGNSPIISSGSDSGESSSSSSSSGDGMKGLDAADLVKQVERVVTVTNRSGSGGQGRSRGGQERGRVGKGGSSSGKRRPIDWSRWKPWFQPRCPFCVKEVEELMEAEQQQRKTGGPGAAAAAELDPVDYPWKYQYQLNANAQQQQQQHFERESVGSIGQSSAANAASVPPSLHGSIYGSWPVRWDCPFKFRRLMWRLMARVKPTALRFWAEREQMCAHASELSKWNQMTASLARHLWLPTGEKKEATLVHPIKGRNREVPRLISQYAQALNEAYMIEHLPYVRATDPVTPLLSAQTLLALGSGHDTPLPSEYHSGDIAVNFTPGAFPRLVTLALQQQLKPDKFFMGPGYAKELGPHCGMVVWFVWWHCGIREQAAWNLYQQQQQQGGQQEVTDSDVEAAVAEAYASPEARVEAVGYACRQLSSSLTSMPEGDLPLWVQQGIVTQLAEDAHPPNQGAARYKSLAKDLSAALSTSIMSYLAFTPEEWFAKMQSTAVTKHDNDEDDKDEWDYGVLCCFCGKAAKVDVSTNSAILYNLSCDACKVPRYCSSSCQERAHQDHAEVCHLLRAAGEKASPGAWRATALKSIAKQPYLLSGDGLALQHYTLDGIHQLEENVQEQQEQQQLQEGGNQELGQQGRLAAEAEATEETGPLVDQLSCVSRAKVKLLLQYSVEGSDLRREHARIMGAMKTRGLQDAYVLQKIMSQLDAADGNDDDDDASAGGAGVLGRVQGKQQQRQQQQQQRVMMRSQSRASKGVGRGVSVSKS